MDRDAKQVKRTAGGDVQTPFRAWQTNRNRPLKLLTRAVPSASSALASFSDSSEVRALAAQPGKISGNWPAWSFPAIPRNKLGILERKIAVEPACSTPTQHAAASRRATRDVDEAAMTIIRLSAPRFGPRRQAGKTHSRRQKFKWASRFSSVQDAIISFA